MQFRKTNLKWWFIGLIIVVAVAAAGLCRGCNASSNPSNEVNKATPQEIIQSYFPSVDVNYNKSADEINFTVNSDKVAGKDVAYSLYSNSLLNCVRELMTSHPDLNLNKVTIESVNVPNVIVCDFNSDKIKTVEDWDSLSIENLKELCTSYTDCMN